MVYQYTNDLMGSYTNSRKENLCLGLVAAFVAVAAVQGIGKAVGELLS